MDADTLYKEISRQVRARYRRRLKYVTSVVMAVVFNVLMWWAWTHTDPSVRIPVPECVLWLVTFFTVMGILSDSVKLLMGELEDWSIRRQFERTLRVMVGAESNASVAKRKHNEYDGYDDSVVYLTDDGELVEGYAETWDAGQKQKRQ